MEANALANFDVLSDCRVRPDEDSLADTRAAVLRLVAARDAMDAPTRVDVSMVVAPETEAGTKAFLSAFEGVADRVQTIPLLATGERRTRCREPWRGGLVVTCGGQLEPLDVEDLGSDVAVQPDQSQVFCG